MKSAAITNPNILAKHKELTKSNYITYFNNVSESNIGCTKNNQPNTSECLKMIH